MLHDMIDGLLKKLRNQIFLKNLALMHNALEELADLSEALQQAAMASAHDEGVCE
jgi:hypothetical protein